jgi:spermidine synthase
MASADLPSDETAPGAASRRAVLRAAFTAAIFVSAALLFAVQPMFTKMVLPRFGGAPSVWSVAIVFFQAALLAGYAYAHWLTRYAGGRASVLVHLAVMIAAAFALPLAIAQGWGRPPAAGEALWLIGLFSASIGLPFFALAANSPLLQAWFARTDHPAARDPYFLYAAGNAGSFLALISYPVVVEPLVRLRDQAESWSIGFCLLIALIAACGALLWRCRDAAATAAIERDAAPTPTWREAASWLALAAVPSGLLVAVTAHISTDVAAVPLLWVLPLALYLLTFVIVFARRPIIPHRLVVALQPPCVVALAAVIIFNPLKPILALVALHLGVFFINVLMCHGELARRRPPPKDLTAFYLWMSAGGLIGGVGAGVIAPHVFSWVAEYPILIALALLCRPGLALPRARGWRMLLLGGLAAGTLVVIACALFPVTLAERTFDWTVGALLVASLLFWRAPLPLAATVAFVLLVTHSVLEQADAVSVRSFFGVSKISQTGDGQFRLLQHGTTLHGGQRIREPDGLPAAIDPPEALLYYWDGSALAQAFEAARTVTGGPMRIAVIGLGTGTLACRADADDTLHYYEIDPAIVRIARDPLLFSFLWVCRPNVPVILGDARLTLAEAPDGAYDLVIVDAFSSDAIPVHLLTREAMAGYLRKLGPHGMIVMHVSNRHLELASVVTGIAAANGLLARVSDANDPDEIANPYKYAGTVVAVARSEEDFGELAQAADWERKAPDPAQWVWSDDYSNIVGAVIRKLNE